MTNPDSSIEVGSETLDVRARELEGDERAAIWTTLKQRCPGFAEHERKSSRQIRVLLLKQP